MGDGADVSVSVGVGVMLGIGVSLGGKTVNVDDGTRVKNVVAVTVGLGADLKSCGTILAPIARMITSVIIAAINGMFIFRIGDAVSGFSSSTGSMLSAGPATNSFFLGVISSNRL